MQVVHFDILDVVAIDNIHLPIDSATFLGFAQGRNGRRARAGGRHDRRNVNMLDALLRLELGVYSGGGGSYI